MVITIYQTGTELCYQTGSFKVYGYGKLVICEERFYLEIIALEKSDSVIKLEFEIKDGRLWINGWLVGNSKSLILKNDYLDVYIDVY
jgi:hypothetical protein